jgi:hypothetical protein
MMVFNCTPEPFGVQGWVATEFLQQTNHLGGRVGNLQLFLIAWSRFSVARLVPRASLWSLIAFNGGQCDEGCLTTRGGANS